MSYIELHARSAFSFLRGGSMPETLARLSAERGLSALGLCDRGGVYGAVRLHMTAKETGIRALVGCELPMEDGSIVPVLVPDQASYRRLCSLLTTANLRAPKGEGRVAWQELEQDRANLIALTGDEEGPLRLAWRTRGKEAAAQACDQLLRAFGPGHLYAELQRHLVKGEAWENEYVQDWARACGVPLLATNGVLHATPAGRHVLDVFTCLRNHVTLDGAGRQLAVNSERHLKTPKEMAALFSDLPEAIDNTQRLADRLDFTLADLGYQFPHFKTPHSEPQEVLLRELAFAGAKKKYGPVEGQVKNQLERELDLIGRLGFCGYFLIVQDLCKFARDRGILIQGRGSAANSTVCYALGITAVDPIKSKLLFERFLSEGRSDWPDIDLDLPSGPLRETVIQEVYQRYAPHGAAMTANVICYRAKNTLREVGKVFGFPDDVLDRYSSLFHGGDYPQTLELKAQLRMAGVPAGHPRLPLLMATCRQVNGLPRHLGQHSGGMVLCAGSLAQYVPLENARMPGRSVVQWDKSDCEDVGIIKIDLLGLGMMAVLQDALEICREQGDPVDLATIPKDDDKTFELMRAADTIGVFQIESRAQMATLPRMKPASFYDVAIEVAIIRPGPIQGNAVNPYLERRAGRQPVTYPDDRARHILERTLGVVLFQEQVLQLAMELAHFSAAEADELRRAIGFTRSPDRLERMKAKLVAGLRQNNVTPEATAYITDSLASFALYGFPESHAISFALLAYASTWLKAHRPAVLYAALLNNQPMGFYSPATLVQDARRHDVKTLPVCVMHSTAKCRVENSQAIRLGLASLKGLRSESVEQLLKARGENPFTSVPDFLRRTTLNAAERRTLSESGALNVLAGHRRAALWQVSAVHEGDDLFREALITGEEALLTPLERMTLLERLQADYDTTGLTTGKHPMALARSRLPDITPAAALKGLTHGTPVKVAGAVICRQRPGTAKGFCFLTLEDETHLTNVIIRPKLFEELRLVINMEPVLIVTGHLQNQQGVIHVMAEALHPMPGWELPAHISHDFH